MAKMQKRFKKTTQQSPNPYFVGNDLIQQDFTATLPNEAWVSDITYVLTQDGWVYCAMILDLFSRRIVGLAIDNRMTTLRRNMQDSSKKIKAVFDGIMAGLKAGKEAHFVGFGSFGIRRNPARKSRKPRTGAEVKIKASNRPIFRVVKNSKPQ